MERPEARLMISGLNLRASWKSVNPQESILNPRTLPRCVSGLPRDTLNGTGTSGNAFENLPAQERTSPSLPSDPKNLASSYCEGVPVIAMRQGQGLRREPQSLTIPTPRFTRNHHTWNPMHHTRRTDAQNCMMEAPRYAISELHFGKFPDPEDFKCWRVNFKTDVCVSTPFPQLTMSWINEAEMAKSTDDLMTLQSIEGKSFPVLEMLDARIASALRRIISNNSFRRRVSVEKRAQKDDRFFRGRQNAYVIYGHFQSTGAYDAAQGLSDLLFNICLQNGDVQDFDTKLNQISSGTSEMPPENVPEGLYKDKLQVYEQPRTVFAMYNKELNRDQVAPSVQKLRNMVRQHFDQTMRTRNFKAQNERIETGVLVKSH